MNFSNTHMSSSPAYFNVSWIHTTHMAKHPDHCMWIMWMNNLEFEFYCWSCFEPRQKDSVNFGWRLGVGIGVRAGRAQLNLLQRETPQWNLSLVNKNPKFPICNICIGIDIDNKHIKQVVSYLYLKGWSP